MTTVHATPLADLIEELRFLSGDFDADVTRAVDDVVSRPLPEEDKRSLLTAVFAHLQRSPLAAQDPAASRALAAEVGELVDRHLAARSGLTNQPRTAQQIRRALQWKTGPGTRAPVPVTPKPRFHGRELELLEGWVDFEDLHSWLENDRLEIHVEAFRQEKGRDPSDDELVSIMLSQIDLPGVSEEDEFAIVELAESIAANGVRTPPVVDHWGVPQDGNRRLAACHLVLRGDYSPEQKARARTLRVWKMSEYADSDDYRAVVVGSNFEPSHKMEWSDYIKARRVAEDWDRMLAAEGGAPSPQRRTKLKQQLAARFVIATDRVDRFLKMVAWADRFEEHHRERGRGAQEVQQKASKRFQYFAEMRIGQTEGGVDHLLRHDDDLRELTFDLLYDGKIKSFPLIRELPKVARSEEARTLLLDAAAMPVTGDDPKRDPALRAARDKVATAVSVARAQDAELRSAGAEQKIKAFVAWLRKVPVDVFEEKVTPETLRGLVNVCDLTLPLVKRALDKR